MTEAKRRSGPAPAPILSLLFSLCLALLPGCQKSPISPDAELLDRPIIWMDAAEVIFSASEAAPDPASQELKIKNSGKSTLKYAVSDDAAWLTVNPSEGSSSGQTIGHAVVVDARGLSARDEEYSATITISCPEAYNNPQKVKVRLKVLKEPPPEISVTPKALTFVGQAGGAAPPAQTILVGNSGKGVLNYTIVDDAAWLAVNPANGSSSGESSSHAVSVNTSGLTEGSYAATITIADPRAANSPQKIAVALQVTRELPPLIAVDKSSLSFSARVGGADPSPQAISVRNGGGGSLTYTVTCSTPWLSASPAGGSSTGAATNHTVFVSAGGLAAGSYTGTISIASPAAANSPQVVGVTLQVTSASTRNAISVSASPAQGTTGTTVTFVIAIDGNNRDISAFGLDLTFDTAMFQYVGTAKGTLTGDWTYIEGNNTSGTVTIGGFAGSGTPVTTGQSGAIAVVTLSVTGGSYSNGYRSQVLIRSYADDISGMSPEPATTTFTYQR